MYKYAYFTAWESVCIILALKKVHIITLRSNNLTENNY